MWVTPILRRLGQVLRGQASELGLWKGLRKECGGLSAPQAEEQFFPGRRFRKGHSRKRSCSV